MIVLVGAFRAIKASTFSHLIRGEVADLGIKSYLMLHSLYVALFKRTVNAASVELELFAVCVTGFM